MYIIIYELYRQLSCFELRYTELYIKTNVHSLEPIQLYLTKNYSLESVYCIKTNVYFLEP